MQFDQEDRKLKKKKKQKKKLKNKMKNKMKRKKRKKKKKMKKRKYADILIAGKDVIKETNVDFNM